METILLAAIVVGMARSSRSRHFLHTSPGTARLFSFFFVEPQSHRRCRSAGSNDTLNEGQRSSYPASSTDGSFSPSVIFYLIGVCASELSVDPMNGSTPSWRGGQVVIANRDKKSSKRFDVGCAWPRQTEAFFHLTGNIATSSYRCSPPSAARR